MEKKTFRKQYVFWLNLWDDVEFSLAQAIAEMKAKRIFATTLRDALRLILALRAGSTDVLEAMFPALIQHMIDSHHAEELERVRAELAELRQRLDVNGTARPVRAAVEEPEPVIIETAHVDVGANFLSQMLGL